MIVFLKNIQSYPTVIVHLTERLSPSVTSIPWSLFSSCRENMFHTPASFASYRVQEPAGRAADAGQGNREQRGGRPSPPGGPPGVVSRVRHQ